MIREVSKISHRKPPDPQVSPLQAAHLANKGPAAAVVQGGDQKKSEVSGRNKEGEEADDGTTKEEAVELEIEGSAVSDERRDQRFASTDFRYRQGKHLEKEEQDKRPASVIVEALNRFSRQGPGGTFDLLGFSTLQYCPLCGKNCLCMLRCMGPPTRKKPSLSFKTCARIDPSPTCRIPGLSDGAFPPSTTLTSVKKTVSKKGAGMKGGLRNIFAWCRKKDVLTSTPGSSNSVSAHKSLKSIKISSSQRSKSSKQESKTKYVDLQAEWKFSKSSKYQHSPAMYNSIASEISSSSSDGSSLPFSNLTVVSSDTCLIQTSALRKLYISELMCKRKSSSKQSSLSVASNNSRHKSFLKESVREYNDREDVMVNLDLVCNNNQKTSHKNQCDHCGMWFQTVCKFSQTPPPPSHTSSILSLAAREAATQGSVATCTEQKHTAEKQTCPTLQRWFPLWDGWYDAQNRGEDPALHLATEEYLQDAIKEDNEVLGIAHKNVLFSHMSVHLSSDNMEALLENMYALNFNNVQIIVGLVKDKWKGTHLKGNSSLHVVDGYSISLKVDRRTGETPDPAWTSIIISATPPRWLLHFNEEKVVTLMHMVARLMLGPAYGVREETVTQGVKTDSVACEKEDGTMALFGERQPTSGADVSDLSVEFHSKVKSVAEVQVTNMKTGLTRRPYDTNLAMSMHSVILANTLQTFGPDSELLVALIDIFKALSSLDPSGYSPKSDGSSSPTLHHTNPMSVLPTDIQDLGALISIDVILVSPNCPTLEEDDELQIVNIQFNYLDLIANQETTIELIGFVMRVLPTQQTVFQSHYLHPLLLSQEIACQTAVTMASLGHDEDTVPQFHTGSSFKQCIQSKRMEMTAELQRLKVLLLRDGIWPRIGTALLTDARVQATLGQTVAASGCLGGLHIMNLVSLSPVHQRLLSIGRRLLVEDHLRDYVGLYQQMYLQLLEEETKHAFAFSIVQNHVGHCIDIKQFIQKQLSHQVGAGETLENFEMQDETFERVDWQNKEKMSSMAMSSIANIGAVDMEQMVELDSCELVTTHLVRSKWPSAKNYIGLKGGSPQPCDHIKFHDDPYQFVESDDVEMEAYQPIKKKVKLKSFVETTSMSIINDLVSYAVDSSEEAARELKEVFDTVMNNITNSEQGRFSCETGDMNPMRELSNNVHEELDDIFLGVIAKYGGPSDLSEGFKMVQCLACHKTTSDFNDLWDKNHECQVNKVMVCDKCEFEILERVQLEQHVDYYHDGEQIVFVKYKADHHSLSTLSCSEDCPTKLCFKMSVKEVQISKNKLSSFRKSELHQFLLSRLKIMNEFGLDVNNSLRLGKHNYCKNALSKLFGLSDYIIRTVFNEHAAGIEKFQNGNVGNLYCTHKKDNAIAFILHFAQCHSENLPDRSCLRLPSYLTVQFIYEHYCEKVAKDNQVGCREFYLIFDKTFGRSKRLYDWMPRITFMSPSSHPVCNECCLISDMRKKAKTESEAQYAEGRKRSHMLYIRRKYLLYCYRCELPVRYPEGYLSLAIDDMDQQKIWSPYTRTNTKDSSGLLRLNNHLTGCIISNGKFVNDKVHMIFLNNDQYPQDSNKTITQIHTALEFTQEKLGQLPRKMMIQTDNCCRDLKNQFLLTYFYLLVDLDVFDEILMSNMPIGHTHNNVDHMFGVLAGHLKKMEIPTFEALKTEIGKIKLEGSFPIVKELLFTSNFLSFIQPYILPIAGHSSFYQFKIRKENNLTRLYVKEDELDGDWKFPMGIKLLRNLPTRMLLEVSPFRSETDYAEIYSSVFKKYFPMLEHKFGEEEVIKIKQDWEKRIQMLISLDASDFHAMDILSLRKQPALPDMPAHVVIRQTSQTRTTAITATFYPQEISSFSIEDLKEDVSLVFYCEGKRYRPWIGLFIELIECDGGVPKVKVEWLKKDKKTYVLDSLLGSKYTSVLDVQSVMFSDCLINTSVTGDRCGPYVLEIDVKKQIMEAYTERDNNMT